MATKASKVAMTEYLIYRENEVLKVAVPAEWKVTFGYINPSDAGRPNFQRGDGGYALRFYETKDKQRAIFTDVKSFRDMGIEVSRQTVTEANGTTTMEFALLDVNDPEAPVPF